MAEKPTSVDSTDLPMDGDHPLVAITQARVDQYRMHRQNVDALFGEVERYMDMLKSNDFPVDFQRLSQNTAAIVDADGSKVMEMEIQRLRPVMLYPTDQMQNGPGGASPMGPRPGSRALPSGASPMIDDDDMDDQPGVYPQIPGPDPRDPGYSPIGRQIGVGSGDAIDFHATAMGGDDGMGAANDDEAPGQAPGEDANNAGGKRRGMTISEIEEAAAGGEIPEGMVPGQQVIQLDPTRGLPASPVAMEALQIRTTSNVVDQPQEIQFIYDMTNPVRSHSFFAHLADVAAYVKDLHDRPAAERKGALAPFRHEKEFDFKPR